MGVDIIVATPGRLDDLINTDRLSLNQVRFLILDEVDALLSNGFNKLIMKLKDKIPAFSSDGKRLQFIVCSATLHNFEVKKLADKIMHFPMWVDLKGADTVPETIHHCVCIVDPKEDMTWQNMQNPIPITDGVHQLRNQSGSKEELLSEAVKLLKVQYCVKAIKKYNMDRAMIFCRTKLDCNNLQEHFRELGGGPPNGSNSHSSHQFSCVCLHSDLASNLRAENLEIFIQKKVRLLVCTDVAARGLDIRGLPFVINLTLPDEKENYLHRIGRVGRVDRMGLALSLVSKSQEKVWYHTCHSKGKNCQNRKLTTQHGCCIWYNEMNILDEIETHLGCTIPQISKDLEIPINEFDGKVTYGEKRQVNNAKKSYGHADLLAQSLKELISLEKKTQLNFLNMKFNKI
jgi:ATP-dependent RNA helicase DDX1